MKPAWTRRLYRCLACDTLQLLPESEVLIRRAQERAQGGRGGVVLRSS